MAGRRYSPPAIRWLNPKALPSEGRINLPMVMLLIPMKWDSQKTSVGLNQGLE